MIEDWQKKPHSIEHLDSNVNYILAVDESGVTHISSEQSKWLSLAGVAIDLSDFEEISNNIMSLKNKYWENGMFYHKRVVFHSRDILKRQKAFCYSGLPDYKNFKSDLYTIISELPIQVISSNINKEKLVSSYSIPYPTYNLAVEFMIERYVMLLERKNKVGVMVFESRDNKEDGNILELVNKLLSNGNNYVSKERFKNRIKGVFFNKKQTEDFTKSYWALEIADLCSNSIYNYLRSVNSEIFPLIENKFIGYPAYEGRGMKIFPK